MNQWKIYDVDIFRLSNKKHEYCFSLDSSFFSLFEDSFLHEGKIEIKISFDKSEMLILADFQIEGYVVLNCDRSLEDFNFHLSTNKSLIFKYGEGFSELTDEIVCIPKDLQKLNLAQYIYEFIGLEIPMKRLHPKFKDEGIDENNEGIIIYRTSNDIIEDHEDHLKTDPRWGILNNLKNNSN